MRKNVFFLARNFEQEGTELTEKPATRLCFLRYLLFIIWLRPDGRAAFSAAPRENTCQFALWRAASCGISTRPYQTPFHSGREPRTKSASAGCAPRWQLPSPDR